MSQIQAPPLLPTPEQCRAARGALGWTVLEACAAADMSNKTLVKFEAGGEVRGAVSDRLRAAFEGQGVVFAPDGRGLTW